MRRLFKILIISGAALGGMPLVMFLYSIIFPWQLTVENVNCAPIEIPMASQDGNPVLRGTKSLFVLPGTFIPITLVSEGENSVISAYLVIGGFMYSEMYEVDATGSRSVQVNGLEILDRSSKIDLKPLTEIKIICEVSTEIDETGEV